MKKILVFTYSIICYLMGLGIIAYYFDFFIGIYVPKYINSDPGLETIPAIGINLLLIILFGIQHSVMARQGFKKRLKEFIPAAAERSTYILVSTVMTAILVGFWQPITVEIFDLRGTEIGNVLWGMYGLGWVIALSSTFLINHFDLFGLKQAWSNFSDKTEFSYSFKTPLYYKFVRHPIYLGWLILHWFNPYMTVGNVLLATGITIYIYIGIRFEEKDLENYFGTEYHIYKKQTPKLIPLIGKK